jgi:transposase
VTELEKEKIALATELDATRREYQLKLAEAEAKVKDLIRRLYGASSEKIDSKQHELVLESVDADEKISEAVQPEPEAIEEPSKPKAKRGNRRPIPANLPVERIVHDLPEDQKRDPQTGESLVKIREEITEEIEYRRSQFVRVVHVVPVYASPSKSCAPVQARLERVIPGSGVGTGLLAYIAVSKYTDHAPLYRIEQIAARQGVTLERTKMSKYIEQVALLLSGIKSELGERLLKSGYVQCDETPVKVLDPDRPGAARLAYLWVRHAPTAKTILFDFDLSRKQEVPRGFFPVDWHGVLQSDAYQVYDNLASQREGMIPVRCWAHARRKWVEAIDNGGLVVAQVLALIAKLYKVEEDARGAPFAQRESVRAARSQIILAQIQTKMLEAQAMVLPASKIAEACSYALNRWEQFTRYAEPGFGHVEIDDNPIENGIRPSALGKKNWLFIGHPDAGWKSATMYSILGTCKLLKVDPEAYLMWVLPKLASGTNQTVGLLPHDYLLLFKEQQHPDAP